MSKKPSPKSTKKSPVPGYTFVQSAGGVDEYVLKSNGLRVLYHRRPGTGVVTSNITYLVGARDEARGETGLAHMLEHMLFKPTTFDVATGVTAGGAMQFERETGCILNANTGHDRTTYFFSYPKQYLPKALQIEAERMEGVILNKEEFVPEQGNVLSEYDMYNGDPYFALAAQMCSTAYHSHPYGHEIIGHREDIEKYTPEKLERFYRNYYRPENAVMMVVGDVDVKTALTEIKKAFGHHQNPTTPIPRFSIREPKQEGLRRLYIERTSSTNIVSIGFRHSGFPSRSWFHAEIMEKVLVGGPESILHKLLVDTGMASSVDGQVWSTSEENLGMLFLTLSPGQSHEDVEHLALAAIESLQPATIASLIKKEKAKMITDETFSRESSLAITQELTQYVTAGQWEVYAKTPEILKDITTKHILDCIKESFTSQNMTIGHFIGKQ